MKTPKTPLVAVLSAVTAASLSSAHADLLVRELWDAIAGPPPGTDATLNGKGDTATSVGMTGSWLTNGSTGIFTASSFNTDGGLPGLPSNAGQNGGVWNNVGNWNGHSDADSTGHTETHLLTSESPMPTRPTLRLVSPVNARSAS